MKSKLFFDFQIDEKSKTIKVVRTFDAPLSLVWKAWTTPEILDQWWASEGYTSSTKTMEFKEGGARHYKMEGPENFVIWGLTSYSKITLHSEFSGKEYSVDEHQAISPELPPSKYNITFIDKGDTCTIRHHTTYDSVQNMKQSLEYGFETGMNDAFARLDGYLGKDA